MLIIEVHEYIVGEIDINLLKDKQISSNTKSNTISCTYLWLYAYLSNCIFFIRIKDKGICSITCHLWKDKWSYLKS